MNLYRPLPLAQQPASSALLDDFRRIRAETEQLCTPLSPEDQLVQSMPDASPVKWHRAHTTWFFETFVLSKCDRQPFRPEYAYLFNSYYEQIGARHPRPERGLLTRPSCQEVADYRRYVDAEIEAVLLQRGDDREAMDLIELGLHHEQQHQELILTDILHAFAQNPLTPAYTTYRPAPAERSEMSFVSVEGGIVEIGHDGTGFAFDNETPRHKVLLEPFGLADRPVTNGEWLAFMEAGGYRDPRHWLSDGWRIVCAEHWKAPLYWREQDGQWLSMTLAGLRPIEPDAPVVHVSFYEADAYARWSGKRLPTEAEWECASLRVQPDTGNFRNWHYLRPLPARGDDASPKQMFGDVWEWTQSAYAPYPGFTPLADARGEYNAKFMINQIVLRGGSCATPSGHMRRTYRNFFYPHQRWQFSGVRLAQSATRLPQKAATDQDANSFRDDVWVGLSKTQKNIPAKYFYDAEGLSLFDAICETPEYYLQRAEISVLRRLCPDLQRLLQNDTALVEFGCGSDTKARILLEGVCQIKAYAPIDICSDSLAKLAREMAADYPGLKVASIVADYTQNFAVPDALRAHPLFGFFAGSTIGNFTPEEAQIFLGKLRALLGRGALLLVGIDLIKEADTLIKAYNDAAGVTAAFNKNLLKRINRELAGTFDLPGFRHSAIWNAEQGRIEMHLVSMRRQVVTVAGRTFTFEKGETIHTENSYKFTVGKFEALANAAGWSLAAQWISSDPAFAEILLAS